MALNLHIVQRFDRVQILITMVMYSAIIHNAVYRVNRESSVGIVSIAVIASLLLTSSVISVSAISLPVTFGSIQNLSQNTGVSTAPVVAVVGSNVYVAWEDTSSGGRQTFFKMSSNGGSSFGPTTQFTGNGLSGKASKQLSAVQIAAEGNFVFLTWLQGGQPAFACSNNSGSSFTYGVISVPSALSGPTTAEDVSGSGSHAYFTWAVDETISGLSEVLFSTSDNCEALSIPIVISTGASGGPLNFFPKEDESAAVGNYVYVTWDSMWFRVSADNGATWADPIQLNAGQNQLGCFYPVCVAREPMIAAAGGDVYVTWPGKISSSGTYEAFVAVSQDHGATFLSFSGVKWKDLSLGMTSAREVQVEALGSNAYVTFRGTNTGTQGTQQYVCVTSNDGTTWTCPSPLLLGSLPGSESGFGGIALDGSNVYVQWPHGSPSQLYLAASQDSGATWASPQLVSSSTGGVIAMGDPGGSQGPLAAANNGHVYVVWEDTSTGNGDIYFRSS